jgi:protease-4
MSAQKSGCLNVTLVLILGLSLLLNLILTTVIGSRFANPAARGLTSRGEIPKFDEKTVLPGPGGTTDKIMQIELRGIISSGADGALGESMVDDVKLALQQATDDSNVKAIVLRVDSPGGEVTASDIIYQAVRKAREKKPVVIYMGSLAASGGYYIACGGSWLVANDTTITGSIGVIIQTVNYQQLFGKIGLESVVFKSGQFKDVLSGARQMTPEESAYIQGLVMQTYDKFVGIVAAERKLAVEELKTGIADGRVISGKDALKFNLINQLGLVEDAYEKARELSGAPGAAVVRYEAGFKLGRLFRMLGESRAGKVEINLSDKVLPRLEPGRLYLLPSFYLP